MICLRFYEFLCFFSDFRKFYDLANLDMIVGVQAYTYKLRHTSLSFVVSKRQDFFIVRKLQHVSRHDFGEMNRKRCSLLFFGNCTKMRNLLLTNTVVSLGLGHLGLCPSLFGDLFSFLCFRCWVSADSCMGFGVHLLNVVGGDTVLDELGELQQKIEVKFTPRGEVL